MKTPSVQKEKLLILIVDDNMCFVERMIGLLDDLTNVGYINVASDYDEASRMVTEERPDLVLLDINLPGKNGIEILKKIRKGGSDCKVIMITNHADEYYRQQCRELGADYFLDKSNDFAKVPSIISRWDTEPNLCPTETNA
jgi:two-component system chemotaxis response regulator CheY